MIGYVTLGVSDMERAKAFYTELLKDMGASVTVEMDRIAFIGKSMAEPMIAVCIPYDEQPNHPGNGNMVAISAGTKENRVSAYRICSTVRMCATPMATRWRSTSSDRA